MASQKKEARKGDLQTERENVGSGTFRNGEGESSYISTGIRSPEHGEQMGTCTSELVRTETSQLGDWGEGKRGALESQTASLSVLYCMRGGQG